MNVKIVFSILCHDLFVNIYIFLYKKKKTLSNEPNSLNSLRTSIVKFEEFYTYWPVTLSLFTEKWFEWELVGT
jgi:hypothetical protein